ncbi:hypothetical protein CKAH01_06984 [Colletotrichum kahawae]|uniref:Uncharacterized protein n=1 Tax=Colletotrichum kahawae TaxID=34407 RepID=A0AAE0D425_COLKA|nr:hypothetical protein CKAH01_06984 [Colletotrichum kahawae]
MYARTVAGAASGCNFVLAAHSAAVPMRDEWARFVAEGSRCAHCSTPPDDWHMMSAHHLELWPLLEPGLPVLPVIRFRLNWHQTREAQDDGAAPDGTRDSLAIFSILNGSLAPRIASPWSAPDASFTWFRRLEETPVTQTFVVLVRVMAIERHDKLIRHPCDRNIGLFNRIKAFLRDSEVGSVGTHSLDDHECSNPGKAVTLVDGEFDAHIRPHELIKRPLFGLATVVQHRRLGRSGRTGERRSTRPTRRDLALPGALNDGAARLSRMLKMEPFRKTVILNAVLEPILSKQSVNGGVAPSNEGQVGRTDASSKPFPTFQGVVGREGK